jgi:hypothetical protein
MPPPSEADTLKTVVLAHFHPEAALGKGANEHSFVKNSPVHEEIKLFLKKVENGELATDQLLNALHLLTLEQTSQNLWQSPDEDAANELRAVLYRELHGSDGADRDGMT